MLFSCGKSAGHHEVHTSYAVIVNSSDEEQYLTEQVLHIDKISWNDKHIYVHPLVGARKKYSSIKILKNRVLIFDSEKIAEDFVSQFKPYINTLVESANLLIVRNYPDISAERKGIISQDMQVAIISPITTSKTNFIFNTKPFSDVNVKVAITPETVINGNWIRVQYQESKNLVRGWVLVDDKTILVSSNSNDIRHIYEFKKLIIQANFWKDIYLADDTTLSNILNNTLRYSFSNVEKSLEAIMITKNNTRYDIPVNQLWPLSLTTFFNPSNNIQFLVDSVEQRISVIFNDEDILIFTPYYEYVPQVQAKTDITEIYNLLTQGVTSENMTIDWSSQFYGFMSLSQNINTESSFKININWHMPEEVAKLYFPKNINTIRGILEFSNIVVNYDDDIADGVIKLVSFNLQKEIFLAYKIINPKTISLQFIPESGVFYDNDHRAIVIDQPMQPQMIFER